MSEPKMTVFLSYSHADADRKWMRAFAESLERRGVQVWFDEFKVRPGQSLRETIEDGLRGSDVLVPLITPHSVRSAYLFFEIGAAVGMGKRVVAIVSKGLDFSLLPQPLRIRRFLIQASPEETAGQLLSEAPTLEELSPARS